MTEPQSDLITCIVNSSDDLRRRWTEFAASDAYVADSPYLALSQIATFAVDLVQTHQIDDVRSLFAEVEHQLESRPQGDRKLLIVGLFEDVQNASLNRGIALAVWEQYLGRRARHGWDLVRALWSGEITPVEFNEQVDGRS